MGNAKSAARIPIARLTPTPLVGAVVPKMVRISKLEQHRTDYPGRSLQLGADSNGGRTELEQGRCFPHVVKNALQIHADLEIIK